MPGRVLYWWTHDLRVRDNQALQCCKSYDALLNVYVVDPNWFRAGAWQSNPMGAHRWRFIQESLEALQWQLRKLGQRIHVVYGEPSDVLADLAVSNGIDVLHTSRSPGVFEQTQLTTLAGKLPTLDIQIFDQATLFKPQQIESQLQGLPSSFSKFERRVMDWPVDEMSAEPDYLPPPIKMFSSEFEQAPLWFQAMDQKFASASDNAWQGGEAKAIEHLERYFDSSLPRTYLATRNALDGWDSSTKFSAYLTHGCLSPKQIHKHVSHYLAQHTLDKDETKSVNWVLKELLWREYFQWLAHDVGAKLYQFKGLAKSSPLTSFYPERFKKWCEGTTPFTLVNACMRELKATGFLSNRGRQIVASCLVNELGLDWRYGAAWFEEQLIDYDVASNWGNWQYIAGVGVDPRGGRHFNLEKQTELYDPDGSYRARWLNGHWLDGKWLIDETPRPLDSVDMVDWPIG